MKEELKTEVTSVAQEELRTGIKIDVPSAEELVARASSAFIRNRQAFNNEFAQLSARGKQRVMNSVLDLPVDGVPVYLNGEVEKLAFALGQRVISDRFIITQHHIMQEVKKQRAAKEAEVPVATSETTEEELQGLPVD